MTLATRGIITLLLITISSGSGAGQGQRTAITGFPPYVLGADCTPAMVAGMTRGSLLTFSDKVQTVAYDKGIQAPIGGFHYRAGLTVECWNDKVAVVRITWFRGDFASVSDMRDRTQDLRQELLSTYAVSLQRYDSASDGVLLLLDSNGNRLFLALAYLPTQAVPFSLSLWYLWALYVQKVEEPAPKGNY